MPPTPLVPRDWKLPEAIEGRLGQEAGRQRAMHAEGHLLLVLHAVPGPDKAKREGRLFWRDTEGFWRASTGAHGPQTLRKLIDEYGVAIQAQEIEVERADEAEDYFRVLRVMTPLLRAARHLHQALQQGRELLPEDRDLIALRDAAGAAERAAELVHSDAQFGLDYTVAKRSEEAAGAQHRLNRLAAFFFPTMTVAAILGTEMPNGLEQLPQPWSFWIIIAASLVLGLIVRASVIATRRPAAPATRPPSAQRRS